MNRRLTLKSESLSALTTDELSQVAGAEAVSVLGRCVYSLQLACLVNTFEPTRCLCP